MSVSSIPVMCYYNGHIVRTDNDVKYDGNKASIVPLEIPVDCTFEQLGDIIFSSTPIDKRKFNLVLKCNYPLKCVSSFQTTNQVLENERGIFVSAHALSCDVSNIANDDEGPDESALIQYHLPPTPCFEHVENIDITISSGWTPWGQKTTSYASGEFVVGQVFNSKSELQEAANIYSIRAHQEFVVVASSKKLIVLRCKKAEECQCQWKLHAMVVKDTSLFVINKYKGPHTSVNPCLNRDHHQLDSKLVATHI